MNELLITIVGGLVVAFIASLFGWGGSRSTTIQGMRVRRTGKTIIIISVLMTLGGLSWANTNQLYGYTLAGYGLLFFLVGKIVAWYQKF